MTPRVDAHKWYKKRVNEVDLPLFQHGENVYRERADKNTFSNVQSD